MSYVKTNWANGDTITADKLNHIEQGVYDASSGGSSGGGPLDVAFAVDMTVDPPAVSTTSETAAYSDVTAAVASGREVRAKISLGTVGENIESFFYAPLQQCFVDTSDDSISEVRFAAVVDIGSVIAHMQIEWNGASKLDLKTTALSS